MRYLKKMMYLSLLFGMVYSCELSFHPHFDCYEDAKNVIYDIIKTYEDINIYNSTILPSDFENLVCDTLEMFKDCYQEQSIIF